MNEWMNEWRKTQFSRSFGVLATQIMLILPSDWKAIFTVITIFLVLYNAVYANLPLVFNNVFHGFRDFSGFRQRRYC